MIEKIQPTEYQDDTKSPNIRVTIAPDNWELTDKINEIIDHLNKLQNNAFSVTNTNSTYHWNKEVEEAARKAGEVFRNELNNSLYKNASSSTEK